MLGFSPISTTPISASTSLLSERIAEGAQKATLLLGSLIVAGSKDVEGILLSSTSDVWTEIVRALGADWSLAYQISWEKWEEIIAGAFHKDRYDKVVLTPRSGDHGRDVIATRSGVGSVKIITSVKAYSPMREVPYNDVRALIGVMSGELNVSKGIIATTSHFPKNIENEKFIAPFLPTRLELLDGPKLQEWLNKLTMKDVP